MTTTRPKSSGAGPETTQSTPNPEELEIAYKIHSLAQIICAQVTAAHPWLAQQAPFAYPPSATPTPTEAGVASPAWTGMTPWTW